jgi:hypothetical protein
MAVAGLTAGIALGGAALADTGTGAGAPVTTVAAPSPSPSTKSDLPDWWKAGGPWFGHLGGGALHGQLVVPKSGGGYETVDVQRGTVTAVSGDALTVRSEDGFSKSYAVNADTLVNGGRDGIGSVKNSAEVSVVARGGGAKPTALRVIDLTTVKNAHERWGFWNWRD